LKNLIEIPKSLWNHGGKRRVHLYALDSSCIGVSVHPIKEWTNVAIFKRTIFLSETPKKWMFMIPYPLVGFYGTNLSDRKVTSSVDMKGEIILITIERT